MWGNADEVGYTLSSRRHPHYPETVIFQLLTVHCDGCNTMLNFETASRGNVHDQIQQSFSHQLYFLSRVILPRVELQIAKLSFLAKLLVLDAQIPYKYGSKKKKAVVSQYRDAFHLQKLTNLTTGGNNNILLTQPDFTFNKYRALKSSSSSPAKSKFRR